MASPTIAERSAVVLELDSGTYWWCSCGLSKDQPWCDGSHRDSEFSPMEVEITEKRRYAFCQCKYTQKPPFCDGTHKRI